MLGLGRLVPDKDVDGVFEDGSVAVLFGGMMPGMAPEIRLARCRTSEVEPALSLIHDPTLDESRTLAALDPRPHARQSGTARSRPYYANKPTLSTRATLVSQHVSRNDVNQVSRVVRRTRRDDTDLTLFLRRSTSILLRKSVDVWRLPYVRDV